MTAHSEWGSPDGHSGEETTNRGCGPCGENDPPCCRPTTCFPSPKHWPADRRAWSSLGHFCLDTTLDDWLLDTAADLTRVERNRPAQIQPVSISTIHP